MTRPSMKIVVGGAGVIGGHIANSFAREGYDVTVVDINADQAFHADEIPQERRIVGDLISTDTLRRAGVADADIYVASSNHHEANALSALKAKSLGAKRVVALIENVAYFDDPVGIYRDWLGIDLVLNTRFLVATEIARSIRTKGELSLDVLAEHGTETIQFKVGAGAEYVGRPLRELRLPSHTLIVAVTRDSELVIPDGDYAVMPGDDVLLLSRVENIQAVERRFGAQGRKSRKTVILGGGTVGLAVARQLADLSNIVVIEKDRPRCELISREVDRVTVIHADGTDAEIMLEEGVGTAEVFAAVTGGDERNIIAARLARDLGAARGIAMVSRSGFGPVCRHIGLETVRSPDQIVLREIVRALIPFGVIGSYPVLGGIAQFVELAVAPDSAVAGRTVAQAGFPSGSVVCALVDKDSFTIPDGHSVIVPGSRAIIFCRSEIRDVIDRMFA
ncbi:MAG TPA: Trk system potassium transporter TrkA [Myxococcota bacterium]|nr:Trk system potassium transporter TrkA [Myxococcota bacterium]HNZ04354.1 Trk system potassium transporter TrkA [Myxococcota bacterium]HOD06838.1 Trk system potassium transporter TrkA [Myxococcota bacterium]HPB50571.1 Trk system potassium transporter TrkA [Myxococcota bacterium]HQP95778.1 Trk system potassium transporter TrkA [Myxococcota bacterium]